MESLALLVTVIVLVLALLGPIGICASLWRAPILGMFLGALAVIFGAAYLAANSSAPAGLGVWAVGTGIYAIHRGMLVLLRT